MVAVVGVGVVAMVVVGHRRLKDISRRDPGRIVADQSESVSKYHHLFMFKEGVNSQISRCSINADSGWFRKVKDRNVMKSFISLAFRSVKRIRGIKYSHRMSLQPLTELEISSQLRPGSRSVSDPMVLRAPNRAGASHLLCQCEYG